MELVLTEVKYMNGVYRTTETMLYFTLIIQYMSKAYW